MLLNPEQFAAQRESSIEAYRNRPTAPKEVRNLKNDSWKTQPSYEPHRWPKLEGPVFPDPKAIKS